MILYHGTSSANAAAAMAVGLQPRGESLGNWFSAGQVPSHSEMVYLTNKISDAEFYAFRAAVIKGEDEMTILAADVDEENLYPDENFFFNFGTPVYAPEVKEGISKIKDFKPYWKESLDKRNLVTHHGPVKKVAAHQTKKLKDSPYWYFIEGRPITLQTLNLRWSWAVLLQNNGYVCVENEKRWFEEDVEANLAIYKSDTYPNGVRIHGAFDLLKDY